MLSPTRSTFSTWRMRMVCRKSPLHLACHQPARIELDGGWIMVCDSNDLIFKEARGLIQATGAPVTATVQPPREGFVANTQRKSNPFSLDAEPDWVPSSGVVGTASDSQVDRKPVPPPRQRTLNESGSKEPSSPNWSVSKSPPAVPRKPLSLSSQPSFPVSRSGSGQAEYTPPQSRSEPIRLRRPTGEASAGATDLLRDTTGEQLEWKPLLPQQ